MIIFNVIYNVKLYINFGTNIIILSSRYIVYNIYLL